MKEKKRQTRPGLVALIDPQADLGNYLFAYRSAVRVLYADIENSNNGDCLIQPLLHLMFHCLELGYKDTIQGLSEISGKKWTPEDASHNIEALHKHLADYYEAAGESRADGFDAYYEKTREAFTRLKMIAPVNTQTAFRYPKDRKGNQSVPGKDWVKVDLVQLLADFDAGMVLLQVTMDVIYARKRRSHGC